MAELPVHSQVHLGNGTQALMTKLARLRVERTRLESQFHMRPTRATAMQLAAIYRQLSQDIVGIFDQEQEDGAS